MTKDYIKELINDEFIQETSVEGKSILHIKTPCRFSVKETIVKDLKSKYLIDEEIGGVLWAKPTNCENEKVYIIDKVSYVRNAVEDKLFLDKNGTKLTKKNAYLPDQKERSEIFKMVSSKKYLPIKFHTHPTNEKNLINKLSIIQIQTETSEQDKLESTITHPIDNYNLLLPRALIVGNNDFSSDIFIGVYNGFICPESFDESKRKVQEENINGLTKTIANKVSSWNLSDNEKIVYGIGAVLLLCFLIYKTRKHSLPAILSLSAAAPLLLANTSWTSQSNYYCRLSFGDANIYIPKWENEINDNELN